jgi:hypothetical protein
MTEPENEVVERVARAIWLAREQHMDERVRRLEPDQIDVSTGAWQRVIDMARAAIAAVPSPDGEIERLRSILRKCQRGATIADLGNGELIGLYLRSEQ